MNDELRQKNNELQTLNDNLESLVQPRTEALEIRNWVLAVSQGVFDMLPVAVFGIDPEQMIAQCNDLGQDVFPVGGMGPLGNSRSDVFTSELNQLIDSLGSGREVGRQLSIKNANYRAEVRLIDSFTAKGMVVALIPL